MTKNQSNLKSLKCLLLNEQIQIENEYFWLCNPSETKAMYSLSRIWKLKVSTFKWTKSIENECYRMM